MSPQASGALVGLLFAIGALTVMGRIAAARPRSLIERVAPYVPATAATRELAMPQPSIGAGLLALAKPMASRRRAADSIQVRLQRAGRDDVDRYRLEQLAMGCAGLVGGGLLGVLAIGNGAPALAALILAGIGAALGLMASDWLLGEQVKRRIRRVGQQLPGVAELLAFAVAAGESPVAAIDRVVGTVAGDLSDELGTALADLRAGLPLDLALRGVAERTGSPEVDRFVDGLIVSMERGTPLADVLRAQAADARAAERRVLMEIAGRKDVAMLIPVVFFILPTVVLVALFPGLQTLQLVVP